MEGSFAKYLFVILLFPVAVNCVEYDGELEGGKDG